MLKKHSDRICTYFKVDYERQFGTRLAQAADHIQRQFSPPQAGVGPMTYVFSWPAERYFLGLDFRRIVWQSLGLDQWSDNREKHLKVIRGALDILEVRKFERLGFKLSAYLPLEMSHRELCDLMFGSFLASADEWRDAWGEFVDPLVHLEGQRKELKYVAVISAMDRRQIRNAFRQHPNLERFVEDKFVDTGIKEFQDRITASDCFFFDIDLFQTEIDADRLDSFTQASLSEAEHVADWCVRRLRSQPMPGGK